MTNPYDIPKNPKLTIRDVLAWIVRKGEVTLADVTDYFGISPGYASVVLLKLHRWGYLRRWKEDLPPRVYRYEPSRFGKKTSKKWKGK